MVAPLFSHTYPSNITTPKKSHIELARHRFGSNKLWTLKVVPKLHSKVPKKHMKQLQKLSPGWEVGKTKL